MIGNLQAIVKLFKNFGPVVTIILEIVTHTHKGIRYIFKICLAKQLNRTEFSSPYFGFFANSYFSF